MNLNELIDPVDQPAIIVEAWWGKKKEPYVPGSNLPPEEQADNARRKALADIEDAKRRKEYTKRKEFAKQDSARLRTKETPSDIPVVGADVPAPPRTPPPKKPKHEDNGGVGPRFGDYVESGNGLWKIVGNDSANMVTFIQNPQSGEKQAVEWSELSKDRDHNGKTIFVRG